MTPMRQKYHLPDWTKRAVARRGPGGLVCLQRRGRVSHRLARERWPAQREDLERELQGRPADLPVPRVRVDRQPVRRPVHRRDTRVLQGVVREVDDHRPGPLTVPAHPLTARRWPASGQMWIRRDIGRRSAACVTGGAGVSTGLVNVDLPCQIVHRPCREPTARQAGCRHPARGSRRRARAHRPRSARAGCRRSTRRTLT